MEEEVKQLKKEQEQMAAKVDEFDLDAPLEKSFEEEPAEDVEVEQPKLTQEEIDKALYEKEMKEANITDAKLIENLEYMMSIGYMNFRVNYNLLTRSNNDLVVAVNKLCNNLVSDSMF
jgi:hypothetical protein